MSFIKKAAWLKICQCGDHGRFVLSDDAESQEFCSKEAAQVELCWLKGQHLIDEAELDFLTGAVHSCRLPTSDMEADSIAMIASEVLNEYRPRPESGEKKIEYIM